MDFVIYYVKRYILVRMLGLRLEGGVYPLLLQF